MLAIRLYEIDIKKEKKVLQLKRLFLENNQKETVNLLKMPQ